MPLVVLLDNSFSMNQISSLKLMSGQLVENLTKMQIAKNSLNYLFNLMETICKIETTSLVTFSRGCEEVVDFTKDYNLLRTKLAAIQTNDRTNLPLALFKVAELIDKNYNLELNYHILIVTDGSCLLNRTETNKNILMPYLSSNLDLNNLNLPKCKINILCLASLQDPILQKSIVAFKEIILKNCQQPKPNTILPNVSYSGGQLYVPEIALSNQIAQELIYKIFSENLQCYSGQIICGNLHGNVSLYPNLSLDRLGNSEKKKELEQNLDQIRICGFLNTNEIDDPPILSRHLVIPQAEKSLDEYKSWISFINVRNDLSNDDLINMFADESKQPSFPVLLHGSLKVANMCALVEIGSSKQWYGMLVANTEKKKSNLMMFTFPPGLNSVPWLGSFHDLTIDDPSMLMPDAMDIDPAPTSSLKDDIKKSIIWLNDTSIDLDIQKVTRLIKRLPDKYDLLINEITRIHKNAITFQITNVIELLLELFENHSKQLTNMENPDVVVKVNHVINFLKQVPI